MALTIQGHFDGKVIVPDEPVDLLKGQRLRLEIEPLEIDWKKPLPGTPHPDPKERRAALERFFALAVSGVDLPDEALRRENIYEDSN